MNPSLLTYIRRWRRIAFLMMLVMCGLPHLVGTRYGFAEGMKPRLSLNEYRRYSHDLAFSPNGKLLAVTDGHRLVRLWDVATGEERLTLKTRGTKDRVQRVAFAPDGKAIALASDDGIVRIMDVVSGKEIARIGQPSIIPTSISMAFTPDGKTLAIAISHHRVPQEECGVLLWDLATRKIRAKIPGGGLFFYCVAFAPDGKMLAVSLGLRSDIYLYDAQTGAKIGMLEGDRNSLYCQIAFSADGRTLAALSSRAGLQMWDVRTKRVRATLQENEANHAREFPIAFSPDGRTLIATGRDNVIHLWETVSAKERLDFGSEYGGASALALSPDGRTLATEYNGIINFWSLAPLKVKSPNAAELARLWSALQEEDAVAAYRAIRTLIASPPQTLPFLRKHLQAATPPSAPPAEKIKRWLADLDSDDFATRQKAEHELEKCGPPAMPALRRALMADASLELRKRVNAILERIERTRAAQQLQQLRALEVLEHIGTAEARDLLQDLAKGVPEARITQEAKASLARLAKRPTPKP